MSRTRAQRRHHEQRLKAVRKHYHNANRLSPRHQGKAYHTPCLCSCWMCGHQREGHGPNMQEVRARLRYTD